MGKGKILLDALLYDLECLMNKPFNEALSDIFIFVAGAAFVALIIMG